MQSQIHVFLSTLCRMLDVYGLPACLWPAGSDHNCAEPDRHSLGFASLDFFASCDLLTLPSQAPLSPGLPPSAVTGRAWPAQRIPLVLPCDNSQATAQRPHCSPHNSFPSHCPMWGFWPLRGFRMEFLWKLPALVPEIPRRAGAQTKSQ